MTANGLPSAPEWAVRKLLRARVARLGTVGKDQRPLVVPVCFAVVARGSGNSIYSPVDGKPKGTRELRRVRNLRENPAATLLVDAWSEQWDRLWWVRVDGVTTVLDPGIEPDEECTAAIGALLERYPQYRDRRHRELGLSPGFRLLLRIDPERIAAWRWSGDRD